MDTLFATVRTAPYGAPHGSARHFPSLLHVAPAGIWCVRPAVEGKAERRPGEAPGAYREGGGEELA